MSGDPASCPSCGGENLAGAKFCGACGQTLSGGVAAPVPVAAPPSPAAPVAPAPAANPKRTMLGMMAVPPPAGFETGPVQGAAVTAEAAPSPAAPAPAPAPAAASPVAAVKPRARTMMGMSPIAAPPPGAAVAPTPAPSPSGTADPLLDPDPHEMATVETPVVSPTPSPAATPATTVPATTNRTMLGMPIADLEAVQAAASAASAASPASAVSPDSSAPAAGAAPRVDPLGPTNRTMLGMVATPPPSAGSRSSYPGPPAAAPTTPPRQRAHRQYADASPFPPSTSARSNKGIVVVGVLLVGLMLVVGAGLGVYLWVSGDSSAVRATVVPTEAGDGLRVEVVGAAEGAHVRFGGQDLVLEDGAAVFPLASDTLTVGDNDLTVDYIDADGQQEAHTVTLTVSYRVRADLSALAADPPALAIVVDALPGAEVTVGDEAVALDAEGRGRRLYPIAGTTDGAVLEHSANYRVALPDGQVHVGSVETRVPFATLQLDRPGTAVVTEAEVIEVGGAIHAAGTVTVGGVAVEHDEGRFVHRHPLPELGEHEIRVVARQPGRAPRTLVLRIRRVADMRAEAAAFTAEPGLDYAKLAQNPTIYRGKQVILEGRVYNVDVANGRSILQILVRDCPRGQRCPLWVTYPQATDATVHDWVRVLGTVTGEQQFRSESDRVITVPRVDAQFVLPAPAER